MLIQIFIGCVFFMMQLSLSKENKCELDTITSYYDWFLWTCEQRFLCTMNADVDLQRYKIVCTNELVVSSPMSIICLG
jgi:hypothetical protein